MSNLNKKLVEDGRAAFLAGQDVSSCPVKSTNPHEVNYSSWLYGWWSEFYKKERMNQPTPGPWVVWQSSPDSDKEERLIITTADGETEICSFVHNPADAPILAAAPELVIAAEALLEKIGHVVGIEPERRALIAAIAKAKAC